MPVKLMFLLSAMPAIIITEGCRLSFGQIFTFSIYCRPMLFLLSVMHVFAACHTFDKNFDLCDSSHYVFHPFVLLRKGNKIFIAYIKTYIKTVILLSAMPAIIIKVVGYMLSSILTFSINCTHLYLTLICFPFCYSL